jgi:hypothetical protein
VKVADRLAGTWQKSDEVDVQTKKKEKQPNILMVDGYRSITFIYFYRMYARKAHTMRRSHLQGVSVIHCKKNVSRFPVPSRYVTDQTLPGR